VNHDAIELRVDAVRVAAVADVASRVGEPGRAQRALERSRGELREGSVSAFPGSQDELSLHGACLIIGPPAGAVE
jgi:hypothetical protein